MILKDGRSIDFESKEQIDLDINMPLFYVGYLCGTDFMVRARDLVAIVRAPDEPPQRTVGY